MIVVVHASGERTTMETFMTESQASCPSSEFPFVSITGVAKSNLPVPLASKAVRVPAYTVGARLLHWITAVLILLMIPLGFVIANGWGGPLQDRLYDLHRSIGAMLIPIVLLRLLVRWARPPAELPNDIPPLQRLAARLTHFCLYVLLLVQPLVGWMATSAFRAPISVFGLFELPPICPENRPVSEHLFLAHAGLAAALCVLVGVHIAAALYHHFVRKDRILMRMIEG
jgi:cytochrome b561